MKKYKWLKWLAISLVVIGLTLILVGFLRPDSMDNKTEYIDNDTSYQYNQ